MQLSVLGALFLSVSAFAQLAVQEPQAAYEGENVSAVALIANPHRDLAPLLPLVEQKAGAPYSRAAIENTAKALKRAGSFADVRVTVEPEVAGLRINFLLEPAFYVGVVEFPGAGKYFSYTRLLQVVNLPDEDPYDASRIPVAEDALREFLHRNGYFQAKVQAESKIDDAHQLVNVNFAVEMGKQARISDVEVLGPQAPEGARLLHSMKSLRARLTGGLLKAGKPYSPERVRAATKLMKSTLTKERRLASSIQENPPQYDAASNRVRVSFKVEVGPGRDRTNRGRTADVDSLIWLPAEEESYSDLFRRNCRPRSGSGRPEKSYGLFPKKGLLRRDRHHRFPETGG